MADWSQENGVPGAEVVSLAEVAKDMRFPVLNELETYWRDLRGARLVPARADVDPRRIEDALEYAFIVERIAPGMARFRLAGMHLNDLMGMEVRGMPLTSFFAPDARKQVSAALESVFDEPAIARLSLAGERGIGRPPLDARLLLLPLQSDFGDVSRALGCLVTIGPVGRAPRRFEVSGSEIEALASPAHRGDRRIRGWSAPHRPGAPAPAPAPAPGSEAAERPGATPGFAEAQAPLGGAQSGAPADRAREAPRPPRAEGRPHLYIVRNDD
jgi:hypothetical protein